MSAFGKMKSNLVKRVGRVSFDTYSINVLPKHMRIPPKKGLKAKGFLFVPEGVKKYSLLGSNRSGINLEGSLH